MASISSLLRIRVFKLCNRHFKYFMFGIFSTFLCLNVILHSGSVLQYYCDNECVQYILRNPPGSNDQIMTKHIQEYWLHLPASKGKFKGNFDSENLPWDEIGRWNEVYKYITAYLSNFKDDNSTFIEIGAYDGEFMSFSVGLEIELGYKGLLIEPNPFHYKELRKKNRGSYSINACVSPDGLIKQEKLWIPKNAKTLPNEMLRRIQGGTNKLVRYVDPQELKFGYTIPVQCFDLGSMALAAFGKLSTSLLIISTHGGELDILENIPKDLKIRVIVLLLAGLDETEKKVLIEFGTKRGLSLFYSRSNMHILIPEEY